MPNILNDLISALYVMVVAFHEIDMSHFERNVSCSATMQKKSCFDWLKCPYSRKSLTSRL
jgi:hypothetical protein